MQQNFLRFVRFFLKLNCENSPLVNVLERLGVLGCEDNRNDSHLIRCTLEIKNLNASSSPLFCFALTSNLYIKSKLLDNYHWLISLSKQIFANMLCRIV